MKTISFFAILLIFYSNILASDRCCKSNSRQTVLDTPLIAMNISREAIDQPVEQRLQWAKQAGFTAQHEITLKNVSKVVPAYDKYDIHLAAVYELLDVDTDEDLSWIDPEFKTLEKHKPLIFLGIKGGSPSSDKLDQKVVSLIQKYSEYAAKHGLSIVLYPHAYYYAERFGDAMRLAQKVDRKNVGVIFNLCHFQMVQGVEDWKKALNSAGEMLWAVTLNGADIGGKDWSKLIQPLDRGSFNTAEFLEYLYSLNFRGSIALQDYGVKGDPAETLKRSLKAFTEITNKITPTINLEHSK